LLIAQSPEPQALGSRVRANLFATAQAFQHMLSALASGTADAAIRGQKCPAGNRAAGVLAPGTSGGGGCQSDGGLTDEIGPKGTPPPPTCFEPVARILGTFSNAERQQAIRDLKECGPGVEDCESLPDHEVLIVGGAPVCAPKDPARCKIKCGTFPIKPVVSFDPNDKVGRAGAGQARYVNDRAPATYTVYFENLETASGAAQEVVVSDTLDTTKLDTSTFTLGPIAFGDRTLTPATGVQTWSGGVDLRPQQNLIVSVEAGLDETTGVATWRFRSLDPDTLEMTDDPTAGFLPPNVTPPEGDGSVSFTIAPKASIADGDLVCNSASIVFDVNAPILTPRFCNTLDVTAPQSQVTSLPPTSPAAPFLVQWTSADNGAGIVGTTIFVSKDGGPYETLVDAAATETSFQFTPEPGRLYAFYSVAVDAAGNREAPPATADAETTTQGSGGHDLAVLAAKVPRRVALTAKKPSRSVQVKVQLQNRSGHAETIATAEALGALVTLHVHSLGPCTDVTPVLRQAPFAKKLPLTWKPKKTLTLVYDARFDCANDASKGTPDYEVTARVNHLAIGNADAHPQDDVCPRTATPGSMDPFPDGKIKERGCGVKRADRTLGGPITVDITVR
ncbi:MAG: hypothetical protein ABIR79_22000, partial [Candidatus Binatia bacterium]